MKLFNTITFLFLCSFAFSQNAPIDFEAGGNGADWTWTTFENDSNPVLEIIPNPDPTGINISATVGKFTALQAGEPWAGCESMHGVDLGVYSLSSANSTVRIMVWKSIISDVGIKMVTTSGGALPELKLANTLVDQWEEITFDFSDYIDNAIYAIEDVDQIVVFPDFDLNGRTSDNVVYFDNITISEEIAAPVPLVAAPIPTEDPSLVISMFSNVYTDVPVDTWLTPWSLAVQEDLQIAGDDTKKYTELNFAGIETTGANLIDASAMEFFHMDVWTPNATTFRIKLVDFGADEAFDGGDDTEHEVIFEDLVLNEWVSYEIPFTDLPGLTSRDNIAQLIISSIPVGGGVVYIDNVYFSSLPSGLEDIESSNVIISPNPVRDSFSISSDQRIDEIRIYDVNGKLVLTKALLNDQTPMSIEHFPKGSYFLKLDMDGKVISKVLIKE